MRLLGLLLLRNFFGMSIGAVDDCRNTALEAVLSLESRTCFWPDAEERRQISARFKDKYYFPKCIGPIDGKSLKLAHCPLIHGENHKSRKRLCAIVMLAVCDDLGRILHCHVGWPGSVHDNRVWRNYTLFAEFHKFFSKKEYLLGDTAFTASSTMIPPFKSTPGVALLENRVMFNAMLARPRVKSEHCIGILKGRFPFLRSIRLKLANKESMKRIITHVRACVVLHNFLIEEDVDEFLDQWLEEERARGRGYRGRFGTRNQQ